MRVDTVSPRGAHLAVPVFTTPAVAVTVYLIFRKRGPQMDVPLTARLEEEAEEVISRL